MNWRQVAVFIVAMVLSLALFAWATPSRPLVVDGELSWNTFFGSSADDEGTGVAFDNKGNTYIVGTYNKVWAGNQDAFVAKLDANGALLWSVLLGGAGLDEGDGIAVDTDGNVYVTGGSKSAWGVPIRPFTADKDAFVAKLNTNGAFLWNTFLGGSHIDCGKGIALDGKGNVCVAGESKASWGAPVWPYVAIQDAFVAKLDVNGTFLWNTFLGGSSSEYVGCIATDTSGNAYIAGSSSASWGVPVRPYSAGSDDAFVAKVDANGWLVWNTFLGSAAVDHGQSVAVDASGNAYATGSSKSSWGSPVSPYTAGKDIFVVRLDAAGAVFWSTFLGGSGHEDGSGIALDGQGNAYVTGYSEAAWGSPVRPFTTEYDGHVAKVDANGTLLWNTFLGGIGTNEGGLDIALDGTANVYVVGTSNASWGSPVQAYIGSVDAVVVKLLQNSATAGPTITTITSKRATVGSTATISGSGFSSTKSKNTVYVGKKKVKTIKKATSTSLKFVIPNTKKGATQVYVVVDKVESNRVNFTMK